MSMDTEIDDLDDEILDDQIDDREVDEPSGRSVRDSLEKAWEDHGGDLPEARKDARERRKEDRQERNGRDRTETKGGPKDAQGRFVSREAPKGDPAQRDGAPAPDATRDAPATSAIQPPNGWSPEAKEAWSKLSPAVQAAVTKRETDMTNGARQLQERYGGIHRLSQALAPRFQRYNLTPDRGFANMASWFEAIETNPAHGISQLAKLYNVDVRQLGAQAPAAQPGVATNGQTPSPRPDPRLDQLVNWARNLEQNRLNEVQQAKLSAWSPQKPHFAAVRQLMGDMLQISSDNRDPRFLNEAQTDVDLDKLYQAAIQSHPEIGPQVIREKLEEERKARQARVDRARQAGGSLRPGTPGSAPRVGEKSAKAKKGETARDTIRRVWDEMRSA